MKTNSMATRASMLSPDCYQPDSGLLPPGPVGPSNPVDRSGKISPVLLTGSTLASEKPR
jgi:hypothetical protein